MDLYSYGSNTPELKAVRDKLKTLLKRSHDIANSTDYQVEVMLFNAK
jgi:translation initiation factor 2 beta subunit (eIF-2beta)/eIF-5